MAGPESLDGSSPPPVAPVTAKKYGVTKPISVAGPTEVDFQRNTELEKLLIDSGLFENNEDAAKREAVLGRIKEVVKRWVKHLTQQRGYTDQMVEDANALIFTFGSFRLGVHGPGSDMDSLCVGPSYVNREEDFFITLHDMLAEMEEVTELQPVPDAHVPVMKFKFQGISIDLLYASISVLVVPHVSVENISFLLHSCKLNFFALIFLILSHILFFPFPIPALECFLAMVLNYDAPTLLEVAVSACPDTGSRRVHG